MPFDSANPAAYASSVDRIRALQASSSAQQEAEQTVNGCAHTAAGQNGASVQLGSEQSRRVHVVCRRGNDSQLVVDLLRREGVRDCVDLIGGLQSWAALQDPAFPAY